MASQTPTEEASSVSLEFMLDQNRLLHREIHRLNQELKKSQDKLKETRGENRSLQRLTSRLMMRWLTALPNRPRAHDDAINALIVETLEDSEE